MKKRLPAVILALALCLGLCVPAFAAEPEFVIENGVLTRYNGPGGHVVIPDGVTEIGDLVFARFHADMTSVTIPTSVTKIRQYAFAECSGLTSVTIPNSVTEIGLNAFVRCTSLSSVVIPGSVTRILWGAFQECTSLKEVSILDGVMEIKGQVFESCTGLVSVTIPDGVTKIEQSVFKDCTSLKNVTIPSSVAEIGDVAFLGCHSLKDVYFGGSKTQWNAITIGGHNEPLQAASIHYNSPASSPAPAFSDTPSWCSAEAQWAVEQGITNGAGSATLFAPAQECTHEQILTFLWRASGKPAAAQEAPITAASYYQDAINWAYEKDFINDSFHLSAPCTRVQAVWYIWKALGEPQAARAASFSDLEPNYPYLPAVSWAVEKEVTKGYGSVSTFAPDKACSRGEIACFLYRAYN